MAEITALDKNGSIQINIFLISPRKIYSGYSFEMP